MAFSDIFKGLQYKKELDELKKLLNPDAEQLLVLREETKALQAEKEAKQTLLDTIISQTSQKQSQLDTLTAAVEEKESLLSLYDDELNIISFGLYKPHYSFTTAAEYKAKLDEIRDVQKSVIKNKNAVLMEKAWTVNNSEKDGKKMADDLSKLLLRAFNTECDNLVDKVKFNNVEVYEERIKKLSEDISKLGKMFTIKIAPNYITLKIEELRVAHEYQLKKQEEKEALKQAREEMKEQQKLEAELKAKRAAIEKDRKHFINALKDIKIKIEKASPEEMKDLLAKKDEIENDIIGLEKQEAEVEYREQHAKAGYVYVISNIGAFGENVYKIGMTRRLDPYERIDELGDASVPFGFDVHAMIFTEDAPKLEAALHNAFAERKVNMINLRREFFYVSLEEIKEVVYKNFDKTVEFIDIPEAAQYRETLKLKGN